MQRLPALVFALIISACAGEAPPNFYTQVPEEPPLTQEEQIRLPNGEEVEHHDDLEAALAREVPEDDASNFDTDEVEAFVDIEVPDEAPSSVAPGSASFQPLLRYGLHPRASDALRVAGVEAWRITQTIGNAAASAGTHAQDGTAFGAAYSSATDISVSGLSTSQIHNLLERLAKVGFVVWYRQNGADGWSGANHMHLVYANSKMKASLRSQVRSWLVGRNGLVSNTIYKFHTFSAEAKATVKGKFAMSLEGTSNASGGGVSGRINTSGAALTIRKSADVTSEAVGSVPNGSYVAIHCQKNGSSVSGTYGTTTLWDGVNGGFVSDAYVATGSDSQVAPTCGAAAN